MSVVVRWLRFIFQRIRLALVVFRRGLPKTDRETDRAVAEFISGQRKPGLPCPRCDTPIVLTIPQLVAAGAVACSNCGLELRMTWQRDAHAVRALESLQASAAKVEQARRFKA